MRKVFNLSDDETRIPEIFPSRLNIYSSLTSKMTFGFVLLSTEFLIRRRRELKQEKIPSGNTLEKKSEKFIWVK